MFAQYHCQEYYDAVLTVNLAFAKHHISVQRFISV